MPALVGDPGDVGCCSHEMALESSCLGRVMPAYDRIGYFLAQRGSWGATDQEIAEELEMPRSTVRHNRIKLQSRGFVTDSGRRRFNGGGRPVKIWVAI